MSIYSHKRAIAYRTASSISEQRSQSEAVFSHASKCSRNTGSCFARCTMLAVSDAEEPVRVLAALRLQGLTINC
ncbi:hypothetical protein [Microcoleus vaginatus]|uniref:hypothetical protein n=1 Tax=Microcoleus vaginatus TaxID=119532 RepID=UPI0016831DB8|nr:hypothetical protein [Microcoleus sp. FACHB-84]MBD2010955.1 hypothetical protein [Microcoleus sp. FACHB-45]